LVLVCPLQVGGLTACQHQQAGSFVFYVCFYPMPSLVSVKRILLLLKEISNYVRNAVLKFERLCSEFLFF
jgi:hypothetical protein